MNTNSNTYTVIYTSLVVVVVAAVLAFVSQILGPKQAANDQAETISQILTAAQFGDKDNWSKIGNAETIKFYKENIDVVEIINEKGECSMCLNVDAKPVLSLSELKRQYYAINGNGEEIAIPVYKFNNGVNVAALYGKGLWGPVWGYIAFREGSTEIVGAYFDHASETPGLGGKIKDDPSFRAQFIGKTADFTAEQPVEIVKGGAPAGKQNAVDAITGATMTSKYLNISINDWLVAYKEYLTAKKELEDEAEVENASVAEEIKNVEE